MHIFQIILLLLFLGSCKEINHKDQPKTRSYQLGDELTITKLKKTIADTVYAENAPSRITRKIRRNCKGNLIISAYEDVILYDGESFSVFPKPDGIDSYDAFDAMEDSQGNIWIASTHYGVFRYDGISFTQFTTDNGLAHNRTIDLHEDKDGNIWIATMGGISYYDGITLHNITTLDGLPNYDINTIIEDKKGNFWIGTFGYACIFDGKTFTTVHYKDDKGFQNVRQIIEDVKGNIWLGGNDGLWRYDGKSFSQYSKDFIGNIYEDKNENIWITSQNNGSNRWALSLFDSESISNGKITSATEIKSGDTMLFGISEDKDGKIWVGTLNGVFTFDGEAINYFRKRR